MLEAPALTGATSQSWCALRGATALPAHHRPVQWLVRAEDARLDAAAVNDPQVKRMMLVMAAGYERLAAHAVCLEQSGLPHEGARADFQLRGVRGTPRSW